MSKCKEGAIVSVRGKEQINNLNYLTPNQSYQVYYQQFQDQQIKIMIQIHSLAQAQSYSQIMTSFKIDSSLGTQATSNNLLKKRVSLSICSSSISLDQMLEYTKQKELFAKYLMANGTKEQNLILDDMRNIYQSSQFFNQEETESFIDLSEGFEDQKGRIQAYFIKIWLKHIGYGTQKNKNYILNRAKIFIGSAPLPQLTKIYQNLNLLPMNLQQKKVFLKQVCQNGWQFFVQEIVKRKILTFSIEKQGRTKRSHIQKKKY